MTTLETEGRDDMDLVVYLLVLTITPIAVLASLPGVFFLYKADSEYAVRAFVLALMMVLMAAHIVLAFNQ